MCLRLITLRVSIRLDRCQLQFGGRSVLPERRCTHLTSFSSLFLCLSVCLSCFMCCFYVPFTLPPLTSLFRPPTARSFFFIVRLLFLFRYTHFLCICIFHLLIITRELSRILLSYLTLKISYRKLTNVQTYSNCKYKF